MRPFLVQWSEEQIAQLRQRLRGTSLPQAPADSGWEFGADFRFMETLRHYWNEDYDWRIAMAKLNRYPQFITTIDGLNIHFVHVRGESKGRRPLLLTHGWPGSQFEFYHLIESLAFPSLHGGHSEDAFDLVIPSLPGFGFSGRPDGPIGQRATASLWRKLMTEVLGYPQFLAQGGDWGSIVTSWLGVDHGDVVSSIHLNMFGLGSTAPAQNESEQQWFNAVQIAQQRMSGYAMLQMFKPQSLAWAAADNPLGQPAWLVERFHDWSDLRHRTFEEIYPLDYLLTNIMLYVITGSFTSSLWYYVGLARDGFCILPSGLRCETPTAFANSPADTMMPPPPRTRVELTYRVTQWTDFAEGGHFLAFERPQEFLQDVREWGRDIWPVDH
ncbi:epoxide hydrolase [Pseudomonas fluorescens]|nr:epoxide hydrolase [Pseudomonas fluorescens]